MPVSMRLARDWPATDMTVTNLRTRRHHRRRQGRAGRALSHRLRAQCPRSRDRVHPTPDNPATPSRRYIRVRVRQQRRLRQDRLSRIRTPCRFAALAPAVAAVLLHGSAAPLELEATHRRASSMSRADMGTNSSRCTASTRRRRTGTPGCSALVGRGGRGTDVELAAFSARFIGACNCQVKRSG